MANSFYKKGAEKVLQGQVDFLTDTIAAVLVKSTYTPSLTTHEFLSDLGANTLGTKQTLVGRSVTGGVLDATDATFPSVASGSTASYIALIKDTGVASTSPLLILLDTITNFPAATNGGDIKAQWDDGVYKIFSL